LSGHAAQTVQTQNLIAASLSGNTAGVLALVSSGTAILAGGNNITLSQNGQSITISGANAGGAQTGISGVVVSDTTYTSGTISFSNAGNITISSSVNGATQYVRLSVAASAPIATAVKAVASIGSTGTITRYAPEDHQHAGVAAFAVTNTGNTAGNTRSQVGTLFLAASGAITASQSTAAAGNDTVWLSVAAQSNQSAIKGFGASNTGNTAGNTGLSTGIDWVLAGSNNITISQSTAGGGPNTLWVSGPTVGGAQTGISGIVVSDTTYTSGTVSFSNAGNITISSSVNGATQYIRLSGNAAQTTQSAIEGFGVSNTGQTAGNTGISTGIDWVMAGSGSITLSQSTAAGTNTIWIQHPAWITTATQSSMTVSDAATSGTLARLAFTNLNGVTLSLSTGAAGSHTIVGSHNAITSQSTQFLALTLGGNTSGTTTFHATNNASLWWNGGNNITLSGNGSTVTISAANQSNQQMTLFATGNTTQSSTGTSNASSLIFAGSGIASVGITGGSILISVPAGGGGLSNIRMSAGTTSNLLSDVTFADSNGISFGINASTMTASANTVGTATTVKAVASANSVGTVTRWVAEDHAHAGIGAVGISTSGNTAGTTGSVQGTYWFEGGSNITVSQITSNNGSHTLVISAGAGGAAAPQSYFANIGNFAGMVTGASAITQTSGSSIFVQPFLVPNDISASYLRLLASFNDSAVGTAGTPVVNSTFSVERYTTVGVVLYTQGTGASSRSLQYVTSSSAGLTGQTIVGAGAQSSRYTVTVAKTYPATGATNNQYTSSYAVSSASIVISSNSNTLFTGPRYLDIPWARSFSAGNYWFGFGASTSSTTNSGNISFAGTAAMPLSINGVSQIALSFGLVGAVTSASDHQIQIGLGVWTTNSSIWSTSSVAISQVSQVVSNPQLPFQLIRQA
jgi:hypothetical protein